MDDATKDGSVERLIEESGLSSLPTEAKDSLIEQLRNQLEDEIGARLLPRMNHDQLEVFSCLKWGDRKFAVAWLRQNDPEFSETINSKPTQELMDHAQQHFIVLNVPGFHRVVRIALNKMLIQLKRQAPEILAAAGNPLTDA